jgi:D-3-phosphoglycerate dehydrogenase
MVKTVILWESPHPDAETALRAAGFEVCEPDQPGAEDAQALVTATRPVDAATLARFPRLSLVAVAFTGHDAVDSEACRARGIRVANVPEYATDATAELALALMLAALRHLSRSHAELITGRWAPRVGRELRGKTIGIVGSGRIGLRLARLLQPFSVRLLGWSRTPRREFEELGGNFCASIRELCEQSELVSLHVALNGQTKGMFGRCEIEAMRRDAWLINVARGALVDEAALHAALAERRIGGAALDVYSSEPYTGIPPFHQLDNVILLPHLGFRTEEALERRLKTTVANLVGFFSGSECNLVA